MESKVVRYGEREDGGRRPKPSGKGGRDKVGWLGRVIEEDPKKPIDPGVLANKGYLLVL